ncbi:MAG: hypothetical protein R2826_00150 [Thermoleophilia bacterium]
MGTFTIHHWVCGIAVTKRSVDLIFHFGGKFLRKLQFADAEDVQQELVLGFVEQAIDRLPYFRENWKTIQAGTLLE